jgi:hypothetical protein
VRMTDNLSQLFLTAFHHDNLKLFENKNDLIDSTDIEAANTNKRKGILPCLFPILEAGGHSMSSIMISSKGCCISAKEWYLELARQLSAAANFALDTLKEDA